jgi:hypothetical protein
MVGKKLLIISKLPKICVIAAQALVLGFNALK